MSCRSCQSEKQTEFTAEMIVFFSRLYNLDEPGVWVFPKLLVCLDCGLSLFTIPETKRRLLTSCTRIDESRARGEGVRDIVRARQIAPQSEQ
jgi:hypothetical protein